MSLLAALASPGAAQRGFPHALVTNLFSGDVSILDTTSNREVARIPIGERPELVAMSPDGRFAYVSSGRAGASDRISMVDFAGRSVVRTVTLTNAGSIVDLEISPDGAWLVAAGSHHSAIFLLDPGTLQLVARRELCIGCGGSGPSMSTGAITFSPDGAHLFATVSGDNAVTTIHLPTRNVVGRATLASVPSAVQDLRVFRGAPQFALSAGSSVVATHAFGAGSFEFEPRTAGVLDLLPIQLGDDLFLLYGNVVYGPSNGAVRLRHLNSGATIDLPASAPSMSRLRFDPTRFEVWGVCLSLDPRCTPHRIDVFHLLSGTRTSISGLGGTRAGMCTFSQDYRHYYVPVSDWNIVEVIDASTKQRLTAISVGTNPRGVFRQGDVATKGYR